MKVSEIDHNIFSVRMNDEEFSHLCMVALSSANPKVNGVSELIEFILTWAEQNWFKSVKEVPLDGYTNPN